MNYRSKVLTATVWLSLIGGAQAIEFKEIQGRWCGDASSYGFAQKQLTVTFKDGRPVKRFRVDSYEWQADRFKMNWRNSENKELFTEFADFSADGKSMAQQSNDAGPRRPFKRC